MASHGLMTKSYCDLRGPTRLVPKPVMYLVVVAKCGFPRWLNAAFRSRAFRSALISRSRQTTSHFRITKTFCLSSLRVVTGDSHPAARD